MTDEEHYKVGAMTVTLVRAPEDAARQWDSVSCECEQWEENKTNPKLGTLEKMECKHIREAKLFSVYDERVVAVEQE